MKEAQFFEKMSQFASLGASTRLLLLSKIMMLFPKISQRGRRIFIFFTLFLVTFYFDSLNYTDF